MADEDLIAEFLAFQDSISVADTEGLVARWKLDEEMDWNGEDRQPTEPDTTTSE